jgi:hypothetical protein
MRSPGSDRRHLPNCRLRLDPEVRTASRTTRRTSSLSLSACGPAVRIASSFTIRNRSRRRFPTEASWVYSRFPIASWPKR